MLHPRRRPKAFMAAVVATLLLLGGAAAAAYLIVLKSPGDISNPDVPFVAPEPTPPPKAGKKKQAKPENFRWPIYGYTADHRREFDPGKPVRGPWRIKWTHRAPALTEFPPTIAKGRIYQLADNARLASLDLKTGKRKWKRKLGYLSASTPALDDGRVYATILETSKGGSGRIVCLRAKGGRILWSRKLSSRSESSPLVHNGKVYFGSENGTVYAMNDRTGHTEWTYRAPGAVKGSPTLSDGLLYFGNYGGSVQAVRARDGKRIWLSSPSKRFLRQGNFYATAAVAFGRVYVGSTDGRMYSFSAKDGRIAWAHQTGNYVYSSAAVKNVDGRGPMVYFGSYDGTFYAVDARSGKVRWRHKSGGKISGSPTIVGDTVYFADLGRAITLGLGVATGAPRFRFDIGAYDPIISDGQNLYLTGNRSVSALEPRAAFNARRKAKQEKQKAKREKKAALVAPAWPERCRQLAPCGPLVAVRERRARAG